MARVVKNEGSAEWRGPHSCRVEFQIHDTATGEIIRERKTFRVSGHTKAEKGRCIREFRAELEGGLRRDGQSITLSEYARQWLAARTADPEIAVQTVTKNRRQVDNIDLTLGRMILSEITRADVRQFQTAIMTPGPDGHAPTISGRPLAGSTAHGIRVTLKAILQEAVRDGLIAANPCSDLKAPSVDTAEKTPLTPEQAAEFRALLDAADPRPTLVAFRLMLFAGLRRGEACGLRWSDFDAENGTISVNRSLCTETLEFKDPKTSAGRRIIPLDAGTVDYLRRFRTAQAEAMLATGRSVADACIVSDVDAEYMHPENLTRSLRRFGKTNNFPGVTPHILRHTYCTLLFAADVDLKTVQYLMGHADPATTLRIYTHYVKSKGIQAAAAVGALMDSLPTTNVVQLAPAARRWGITARSA